MHNVLIISYIAFPIGKLFILPESSSASASLLLATKTAFTVIAIGILSSKYAYLNIVYFGLAYI